MSRIALVDGVGAVLADGSGLPVEENAQFVSAVRDLAALFGAGVEAEAAQETSRASSLISREGRSMSLIRRVDHIAVAVRDTTEALATFRDLLGLEVVHQENLSSPPVMLTYLDCGNVFIQLVEPTDPISPLAELIDKKGEGVNHICFAVNDVLGDALALAGGASHGGVIPGQGRGRVSAFVPGPGRHGVKFECTEFRAEDAVRGGVLEKVHPAEVGTSEEEL
jgi:methylmalonyl-CoA epimerase